MKKVFAILTALLLLGIYCVYTILAVRPTDSAAVVLMDTEELSYVGAAESVDLNQLYRMFDHAFPVLDRTAFLGKIVTTRYDGRNARLLTLDYGEVTLTCIQPAGAAPLLHRPGLNVISLWSNQQRRYSVLSMPVVYAENGGERCLYFSDESAAYCFYAPDMPLQDFLSTAGSLKWV